MPEHVDEMRQALRRLQPGGHRRRNRALGRRLRLAGLELHRPSGGGKHEGKDQALAALDEAVQLRDEFALTADEFLEEGDTVVVLGHTDVKKGGQSATGAGGAHLALGGRRDQAPADPHRHPPDGPPARRDASGARQLAARRRSAPGGCAPRRASGCRGRSPASTQRSDTSMASARSAAAAALGGRAVHVRGQPGQRVGQRGGWSSPVALCSRCTRHHSTSSSGRPRMDPACRASSRSAACTAGRRRGRCRGTAPTAGCP